MTIPKLRAEFRSLGLLKRIEVMTSVVQLMLAVMGLIVSIFFLRAANALTETQLALQHRAFLEAENERAKEALADANRAFNLAQYGEPTASECRGERK